MQNKLTGLAAELLMEEQVCDMDEAIFVEWLGWKVTFEDLLLNGWDIIHIPAYVRKTNATPEYHEWNSREKIYLRHKEARLMGRITISDLDKYATYKLDFLVPDKKVLGKVKSWLFDEITEDDKDLILSKLAALADKTTKKKLPPKDLVQYRKIA